MITDAEKELFKEQAAIRKPFEVEEGEGRKRHTPKDNSEAMAQLKGLYAATWHSIIKFYFFKDLGYENVDAIKKAIKEKIEDLDKFIAVANNQRLTNKNDVPKKWEELNDYDYYLRLKYDYYSHKDLDKRDLGNDSPLSKVYGTYFLFYDFLKDKLNKLEQQEQEQIAEQLTEDITSNDSQKHPAQISIPECKDKIKAPIIATFCKLINEAKIMVRLDYESVETYCKKVCDKYKLLYTDRVRQNFNGSDNRKNKQKVKELILPTIDSVTSKTLTEHLVKNNK